MQSGLSFLRSNYANDVKRKVTANHALTLIGH